MTTALQYPDHLPRHLEPGCPPWCSGHDGAIFQNWETLIRTGRQVRTHQSRDNSVGGVGVAVVQVESDDHSMGGPTVWMYPDDLCDEHNLTADDADELAAVLASAASTLRLGQHLPTSNTDADSVCPVWCTKDRPLASQSDDTCTWHHAKQTFTTSADTKLELSMDWHAYDNPAPDDIPPFVEIDGDDGSGSEVHLQVRAPDLRRFAARLVAMADAFEADAFEAGR